MRGSETAKIFGYSIETSLQRMKKISTLLVVSSLLFSACKKDFKLTSSWKEQMVIYGLLNQSDSVQYIRINKTYLGEGNAYSMAAQFDSINYNHLLNVRLEKWVNGSFKQAMPVDTTTGIMQDPGVFANNPRQILYRVKTPLTGSGNPVLTDDAEYRLTVTNPTTGYTATAKTALCGSLNTSLILSPSSSALSYNFFNLNPSSPFRIHWQTAPNGKVYQPVLRFHYTEYTTIDTTAKFVDLNFGQYTASSIAGGEDMEVDLTYQGFLSFLNGSITNNTGIAKRIFGSCELIFYVASDEYNTYIQVNKPVSSITGDKPTYTNVNNGIGLFSARYTYQSHYFNKPVNNQTVDNASQDPQTCHLHFADSRGNVCQ
jgi:hypothetical protein